VPPPTANSVRTPASPNISLSTQEQLIRAGERLFAEHGIEGVSLRQIGASAGQRNSGVTQYHFGSKDDLVHAIVAYRLPAVNARREALLDRIEYRGSGGDLTSLAEALVLPMAAQLDESENHFLGFLSRLTSLPTGEHPALSVQGAPLSGIDRLMHLVYTRLSHLPAPLYSQRFVLASNTAIHALADRQHALRGGRVEANESALFVAGLVDAVTGLLDAPLSEPTRMALFAVSDVRRQDSEVS
jgi:AcrR family transcriptional regulator